MDVTHATFTLERRYPASVERVFRAFATPEARKRWMAQGAEHSLDFAVGGEEVTRGQDAEGRPLTHRARFVDIVPEERVLTSSTLHTGERLSTASVTSVEFHPDGGGTRLVLTEHGVYLPGQERPEWREAGTAQQLEALAAEFGAGSGSADDATER